jgi:hypothetical protein
MSGPVRELQIAENLMLYVSDQGFLVIAQDMGDASYVALHPEQIDEVIAGMKALKESTVARRAMTAALQQAEYQAHLKGGEA